MRIVFRIRPVSGADQPRREANPPPLLGEHTVAILVELGHSQAAIKELEVQGFVL